MSICRPQKGGEHLDQFELHWTNTLTEHFAELPPVVRQTDRQTVSYLLPAASSRRSCTRCRCCRRRRARSSRCRWAPAPWTCRWRRRRPWTHRRGWRWTRWSCPDRSSPGTARFRCSSGTDRSSPPAECPRRPRSSTAGWSTPRWRWRRGWWRWPTGRRWRGSCARSWSGRSWQPRRRGAWWWWCWGPRGPSSTGVQRGGVCSVLRISEPVLSKLTSAASDPVETLNHSRTTYLILFFISIYTDCARLYSLTASLRSRIHGKVGLCFSSCVSFSFITLLQKTKWALRREETEEEEKKNPHTHKPQESILTSAQILADLSRICPPVSRPQSETDCYSDKTSPAQSFTVSDLAEMLSSVLDDTPTTAAEVLLRQSWRIALDITGPAHIP